MFVCEQCMAHGEPGVGGSKGFYRCQFCGNNQQHFFGYYESMSKCRQIAYCRGCIQFGKVSELTRVRKHFIDLSKLNHVFSSNLPELTNFQKKGYLELIRLIEQGERKIDLIAVTGAGKTELVFKYISTVVVNGKVVAYVCPRKDVIIELSRRVDRYFPEHLIVTMHDNQIRNKVGHIFLLTIHQLVRFREIFDVVIIDESDAFPFVSESEDAILQRYIEQASKKDAIYIYLTATPKVFHGGKVFLPSRYNLRKLALPKYEYVPFLMWRIKHTVPIRIFKLIRMIKYQWLIFVPTIEIGNSVLTYFKHDLKEEVCFVHSKEVKRGEYIQLFRENKVRVLITTSILERGVTFENVSVFVLFPEHELFSKEMLVQICGRVDRLKEPSSFYLIMIYQVYSDVFKEINREIERMNMLHAKNMLSLSTSNT